MKRILSTIAFGLLFSGLMINLANAQDGDDKAAIQQVIESAYVKGIHIDGDPEAIRQGFHPEFTMFINRDNKITKVKIEDWIQRIIEGKKKNPNPAPKNVTSKFSLVDYTGNAAVARIELYKDGKHNFTDYMALYKFSDGWKIVAKIFQSHR